MQSAVTARAETLQVVEVEGQAGIVAPLDDVMHMSGWHQPLMALAYLAEWIYPQLHAP